MNGFPMLINICIIMSGSAIFFDIIMGFFIPDIKKLKGREKKRQRHDHINALLSSLQKIVVRCIKIHEKRPMT